VTLTRPARCEHRREKRGQGLAFLVTFWAMPKSDWPRAATERAGGARTIFAKNNFVRINLGAMGSHPTGEEIRPPLPGARYAPHQIKLIVRPHAAHVGEAIAHAEEGGDGADVPDVIIGETVRAQRFEIDFFDFI
jgi:hypothetical protein